MNSYWRNLEALSDIERTLLDSAEDDYDKRREIVASFDIIRAAYEAINETSEP